MAFPTTNNWFRVPLREVLKRSTGAIDFDGDTWKAALYTDSVVASSFLTELGYGQSPWNANEVANANGYTTAGVSCGTPAFGVGTPAPTNSLYFDLQTDATWTSSGAGFSSMGALIYSTTATGTVGNGLCTMYFGAASPGITVSSGGVLTIQFAAGGVVQWA